MMCSKAFSQWQQNVQVECAAAGCTTSAARVLLQLTLKCHMDQTCPGAASPALGGLHDDPSHSLHGGCDF